jgi:hypothetical protein
MKKLNWIMLSWEGRLAPALTLVIHSLVFPTSAGASPPSQPANLCYLNDQVSKGINFSTRVGRN